MPQQAHVGDRSGTHPQQGDGLLRAVFVDTRHVEVVDKDNLGTARISRDPRRSQRTMLLPAGGP